MRPILLNTRHLFVCFSPLILSSRCCYLTLSNTGRQFATMGSTQNKSLADLKNKKLLQTKGYINGEWCDAKSGKTFEVVDPATGDTIATLPEMGKEDTARAIDAAHEAFQTWKLTDGRTRARLLRKWNDLCIANADDLALILTLENGKPLPEAKGEVLYGTSFIEWFAGEAER
jgi:succinate-semialdehyde dehydrogenase / glutarate-semialdehyde dehydrogenase